MWQHVPSAAAPATAPGELGPPLVVEAVEFRVFESSVDSRAATAAARRGRRRGPAARAAPNGGDAAAAAAMVAACPARRPHRAVTVRDGADAAAMRRWRRRRQQDDGGFGGGERSVGSATSSCPFRQAARLGRGVQRRAARFTGASRRPSGASSGGRGGGVRQRAEAARHRGRDVHERDSVATGSAVCCATARRCGAAPPCGTPADQTPSCGFSCRSSSSACGCGGPLRLGAVRSSRRRACAALEGGGRG